MKLVIIITILVGLLFGYGLSLDPGYALLSWYNYTFESSLWLLLTAAFLLFLGLYISLSVAIFIIQKGFSLSSLRKKSKAKRAQEDTNQGLIYLANGEWDKAERLLTRSAHYIKFPLVNYLAASRAAIEKSEFDQADKWLDKASGLSKSANFTVNIAKANILLNRNQLEQALAVLLDLHNKKPQHTYILKLLVRAYEELEEWSALNDLLPLLKKHSPLSQAHVSELAQKVQIQMLERAAREDKQNNKELKIRKFFNSISKSERYQQSVIQRYLELLIELNKEGIAEEDLRQALKHIWNDQLIELYGKLAGDNPKAQFLFAKQQLKERPNDPILLLSVARLALKNHLIKEAKAYIETGLRIKSLSGLQAVMGEILVLEGNHIAACDYLLKAVNEKSQ